jgi:hypothetical protein
MMSDDFLSRLSCGGRERFFENRRVFFEGLGRFKELRPQLDPFRIRISDGEPYESFPNIPAFYNPFVLFFARGFRVKREREKKMVEITFCKAVHLETALAMGDM